jgi:hypothetical protein
MRSLGFHANALLCVVAAAALVVALGRPWYAPTPTESVPGTDLLATIDGVSAGVGRWFGDPSGTTAWQAFGLVDVICAGMATLAGAAALAALAPALQEAAAGLVRPAVLVAGAIVAYHVVNQPGPNEAVELRSGALIALGAASVLAMAGSALADAPARRPRAAASFLPR